MDKKDMLCKMTAHQFAAHDIKLYLDTHPNDAEAVALFCGHTEECKKLRDVYEAAYGPISPDSMAGGTWKWIEDPWPWEKEAN